jgi:Holliday junction resolvasome RuvABC endonuclease subunit
MSTLALDLGTHTGFALRVDALGTTISGTWDFSTKRHEDAGMRFVRFREALQRMRVNNGVTKIYFPVGEIKKSFTGKGNAPKEAMIAEARRRGYEPVDDNEADAIAILELKLGKNG